MGWATHCWSSSAAIIVLTLFGIGKLDRSVARAWEVTPKWEVRPKCFARKENN